MNITGQPLRQKVTRLVSPALRNSARGQPCTLRLPCCNHDTETTVLSHLRYFGWAGIAQKPHDFLGVFACSACHDAIDGRVNDDGFFGFEDLLRALGETLTAHFAAGRMVMK